MRTLTFILGGLVLLAACLVSAKVFFDSVAGARRLSVLVFLGIWLVVAAVNMWVGVSRAGYSVAEEFPVFLVLFGLPAAVAIFVRWKFL